MPKLGSDTTAVAVSEHESPHVSVMLERLDEVRSIIRHGSLKEILQVQSQSEALKHYAKRHAKYRDAFVKLSEISALAAIRAGELLAGMGLHGGARRSTSHDASLKLSELGINKDQSSRWQALARIPVETRQRFIADKLAANEPITLKALGKLTPRPNGRVRKSKTMTDDPTAGKAVDDLTSLTGRQFATIYADPPWPYDNQRTRAATDNHYHTLSVDDICALPVAELSSDDAQLHLWTTNGFLAEALRVIEAWGFSYRSCFVWCKPQMGIGNYWRVSHEFLLLGVRGSATFQDKTLKSWCELHRGRHSTKPEAVRDMIERAWVGPRLELFGRIAVPGWTVFGNEVEKTLFAG